MRILRGINIQDIDEAMIEGVRDRSPSETATNDVVCMKLSVNEVGDKVIGSFFAESKLIRLCEVSEFLEVQGKAGIIT